MISLSPTRRFFDNARQLLSRTLHDSIDDRVPGLAAEMAFFAVLALPPLMLVILGSVGFIADSLGQDISSDLQSGIIDGAATFLTETTVEDFVEPAITSLFARGRADIVTIGIVVSLWSASRATRTIMNGVAAAYDRDRNGPWWRDRIVAFGLTVAGIVAASVILPMLVVGPAFGGRLADRFGLENAFEQTWAVAYWPTVAILGITLLTWAYHLACPDTKYRRDLPGALLALFIWTAGSFALRFYVVQILEVDSAYSLFAAPLGVMLWLYLTAFAVLIGAEFNAEIEKLWPSNGSHPAPPTDIVPRPDTGMKDSA